MSGPSLRDLDGHDPYELLGVPPTATRAEIVAAHRRQVQLVHPDRPGGDEYETKLLHIAKAVLLDPRRRAEFDAARSRPADDDPPDEWGEWSDEAYCDTSFDGAGETPGSVWDSEEVVTGAGQPQADAPPPWDAPPPQDTTAHWPPYPPPPYPPPPYPPPPPPPAWQPPVVPVRPSVSALPIVALVLAATCCSGPVGLGLGVAGLVNPKGRHDRPVAVVAVALGALSTLYVLLWLLSTLFANSY